MKENLKSKIRELQTKLEKSNERLKKVHEEKRELQKQVKELNAKLEKKCFMLDVQIKSGENNAYSDNIRQTTMLIQSEAGASTANVENVIRIVGKHVFDYNII